MLLVIFDIDGTLLNTCKVDGDCYVRAFIDRFVALLRESYENSPDLFQEIRGASNLLKRPWTAAGLRLGVATGGWRASADCIAKAKAFWQVDGFARTISVGDQVWDVKAARAVNLPFIGVGDPDRLYGSGATQAVPDFEDPDGFIDLLGQARVPAMDRTDVE